MTDREAADHCETLTCTPDMHDFFLEALRKGTGALRSKASLVKALRVAAIYMDELAGAGNKGAATDLRKLRRALKRAGENP